MKIALVGCGNKKRLQPESNKRCPAKELYTSSYFNLKQEVAEEYDIWFILSAKYGLVNPEQLIASYDLKLTTKLQAFEGDSEPDYSSRQKWAENIVKPINNIINNSHKYDSDIESVTLLAGQAYTKPIIDYCVRNNGMQADIETPFDDTSGLFEQMDWLKAKIETDELTQQTQLTDQ